MRYVPLPQSFGLDRHLAVGVLLLCRPSSLLQHVLTSFLQRFRTLCNEMILNQKLGGIGTAARFEFQYLPGHGQMTELGSLKGAVDAVQAVSKTGHGTVLSVLKILAGGLLAFGIMRFGLRGAIHAVPTRVVGMLVSQ